MFIKLRNKFLILNMSITSLVMIAAFATVYFITYNNIQSEIHNKLNAQSEMQVIIEESDVPNDSKKEGGMTSAQNFSLDGPLSFNIEVDPEGKILEIVSPLNIPEESYSKA
ncbi:MAG: two-component sensor histidine kinase, partial [Dehalobacterium sp.]